MEGQGEGEEKGTEVRARGSEERKNNASREGRVLHQSAKAGYQGGRAREHR